MTKIEEAIKIEFEKEGDLAGIEFLRCAVQWMDNRAEQKNAYKTPTRLLTEYAQSIIDYDKS